MDARDDGRGEHLSTTLSADAASSERSPRVTDDVSARDDVTATDEDAASATASSDGPCVSSVDDVNTECCPGAAQPSAGEPAGACSGNSDGFPGVDIDAMIARQRQLVSRVNAEREDFLRQIEFAEGEIQRAAERVYGAVDNRVNELLSAAAELRAERASQLDHVRTEVQSSLAWMNYHHMFAEQLLQHGSAAELVHYAPLLHDDAQRICSQPMPELPPMSADAEEKLAELQAFASLNVDELRQQVGGNLVGHVSVDTALVDGLSPYLSEPRLIAATAVGNGVRGVALLDNELFVVRERSAMLEVYMTSSDSLEPSRHVSVEQMTSPTSIAACSMTRCVFISDSQVCGVFRVSSIDDAVTLVPVDGVPCGLSVSSSGRDVVMTFVDSRRVVVMSSADGTVTRQLDVVDAVSRPVSAVPVNGEDSGFLVCSEADDGRLSWYICGHQLHSAAARSLEQPVHLQSLADVSAVVADAFGCYVASSRLHGRLCLYDATFTLLRRLLSPDDAVTSLALSASSGQAVIALRNGVIQLYQLMIIPHSHSPD